MKPDTVQLNCEIPAKLMARLEDRRYRERVAHGPRKKKEIIIDALEAYLSTDGPPEIEWVDLI